MLVAWTSVPPSKPEGLPGPAGSAGLLTDVSYTKSRQDANFDSRFWQRYQKNSWSVHPWKMFRDNTVLCKACIHWIL